MSDTPDIVAQLLEKVSPRRSVARVLLDQELHNEHERLDAELTREKHVDRTENRAEKAPAIARQVVELEERIEAAKVEFTFQSVGFTSWLKLKAKYPPTQEQRKANPNAEFNIDTFLVPAIAASIVEINGEPATMTVEQVAQLERGLNEGQFATLWQAALDANQGDKTPKSWAAGATARVSDSFESTPALEESLDQSS